MKTYILILLLYFFQVDSLLAQEKDTLFFSIDKYYTISPTLTYFNPNQSYNEWVKERKEQMKHTKTNGTVSFIGNGYLIKNLKPKTILSVKDFIENKKFYHDGKYNEIIDKWKLKDSLTDKYTIFFVNGDEFIEPRYLSYNSYYPYRDEDRSVIENRIKDTLLFKLDKDYLYEANENPKHYALKEGRGSQYFIFMEQEIVKGVKDKELLSLKEFVYSSRFYNKDKKRLDEDDLASFLNDYVVFLVNDDKSKYIKVYAGIMTED